MNQKGLTVIHEQQRGASMSGKETHGFEFIN